MKKSSVFCIPIAIIAMACSSTGQNDIQSQEPNTDAHGHHHLNREDLRTFEVDFCSPQLRNITDSIEVRGMVDAPPQSRYDIGLPFGGEVRSMHFYEGAYAEKGAILASVKHISYIELQEEFLQLVAKKKETDAALLRQEALLADNNTSEKLYKEVRSAHELNEAKMDGVKARLRLAGIIPEQVLEKGIVDEIELRAPVSGYITDAFAHIGMYVAPNAPIYRMVDPSHMHIELDVYQDKIGFISKDQKVKFRFGNSDKVHTGEVFLISQHVQSERGSVNVHVHPTEDHIEGMMPGMYVQAAITTSSETVYALPPGAAVAMDGKWMGIVGNGEHWELIEFDTQQILPDAWVLSTAEEQRQFVCKNLLRALSSIFESEQSEHRHSH